MRWLLNPKRLRSFLLDYRDHAGGSPGNPSTGAARLAFLFSVSIRSGFFEALGKEHATLWDRVHEANIPVTQADLRDLIEMEVANYLEFMPRIPFTTEELDKFEANVETGKHALSPLAYAASKVVIAAKRIAIAS